MRIASMLSEFEVNSLDPIERILLETDGTVTSMLEAACLERIVVVNLAQHVVSAMERFEPLQVDKGERLMGRKVLLQGERTGANYVYAESVIAIDRIEPPLRHGLLASDEPIGRIWQAHRLETFKEILWLEREPAGRRSRYFRADPGARLLVRTYRVYSQKVPVMLITEYFSPFLAFHITKKSEETNDNADLQNPGPASSHGIARTDARISGRGETSTAHCLSGDLGTN